MKNANIMIQKIRKQLTFMSGGKKNRQKGFTLVELAIAMGIIGLLVGGVLKGRAMVENAKYKKIYNDCISYTAAIISYKDATGVLPGDEDNQNFPAIDGHEGDNNGNLAGIPECSNLFEDLVNAGYTTQRPTNYAGYPIHVYGKETRIWHAIVFGRRGLYLWFYHLPIRAIAAIDRRYDDGIWNTGTIMCENDWSNIHDGGLRGMIDGNRTRMIYLVQKGGIIW